MMNPRSASTIRITLRLLVAVALSLSLPTAHAQAVPDQTPPPPAATSDDAGPQTDSGGIIIKKKKDADEPAPPPAPAEPKIKNPNNDTYSIRVDVPVVNLDVNVFLDKTHQFVPGLQKQNFLVLEDDVPQTIDTIRTAQTPITAVMLLEFAANSYYLINDMRNASASFFHSLRPDDYVAVVTYDLRTHILTDFTTIETALRSRLIRSPFPASPTPTSSTRSTRRSTVPLASKAASTSFLLAAAATPSPNSRLTRYSPR